MWLIVLQKKVYLEHVPFGYCYYYLMYPWRKGGHSLQMKRHMHG